MADVLVVIGAGQIGQGIARRVGVGKHVLLADLRPDNANAAADILTNAGYEVSVASVDASSPAAVHALVEKQLVAQAGPALGEIGTALDGIGHGPRRARRQPRSSLGTGESTSPAYLAFPIYRLPPEIATLVSTPDEKKVTDEEHGAGANAE